MELPENFNKEEFNRVFKIELFKNLTQSLYQDNLITYNEFNKINDKIKSI